MSDEHLNRNIQQFYDAASHLWETTWGEHMHHGYYGADGTDRRDHVQAQIDMIEELLHWGNVKQAYRVLDVGCGIGGSSLYLAKKIGVVVCGITLSPVQAARARQRAAAVALSDRTSFYVADASDPPFAPESFDLIWSLESGEHMPDKRHHLQVCADMLTPGGLLLMATWCHRPLPPVLSPREQRSLRRLYRAYHLPYIISMPEYARFAAEIGYTEVTTDDWTQAVAPFWPAVVRSALHPRSLKGLIQAGWPTIWGALSMGLMIRGYRSGLIRFGVLKGRKP